MKLEIFDKSNCRQTGSRAGYRSLNINRKNKAISFSQVAIRDLGLSTGSRVSVARDCESRNDWYIRVDKGNTDGMQIRAKKNSGYCKKLTTLYVGSSFISSRLLDSLGAKKGASLLIAAKTVDIDGVQWYQLITSKPLRIN